MDPSPRRWSRSSSREEGLHSNAIEELEQLFCTSITLYISHRNLS